jgi:uncharacterized repeat protein (TIGR01451 family)
MTGSSSAGWVLGGNPNTSLLTGNGTIDAVGSGWLRLTDNEGNQTGYAYNTTAFDLSQGLLVQFDYATWGGSGADGYSVYLFDAGVVNPGPGPFNIGAFGGSLGYAQKLSTSTCNPPTASVAGISGGYIGIGVDEYGNFAYGCEGRYLGNSLQANTVTVRGSVVGFGSGAVGSTLGATSYPWIATSANNGSLWYNGTTRPDQTSANYRRVTIEISPAPNPVANVWVQFGYNTTPVQMIANAALPAISTSQSLMIGYAASTGGSTNYHEIRNLLVTNAGTSTAIDLGITKTAVDSSNNPISSVAPGGTINYLVTAINYGPNNVTATGVGIQDNIPSSITGVTWTCTGSGGATCGAASGSGNTLNTTANLPQNGIVTYTITGTVSATTGTIISNTASLVIPGSITDFNSNDNSATSTITVETPGTGNKPLYLYYDTATTGHLYREPSAVTTNYVSIAGGSTTVSWALSPVLQSAVTVTGGAGVTIPVQLYLATNSARTYTLNPITLTCGATTLGTLTTGTAALTGTTTLFTFNVPHTTTQTCAAGSAITLAVTNTQTAGRNVYVYPAPATGNYSNVNILSQSIINVNNVGFYSASYLSGGGTALASVAPGQTVYIRSTISDPFGSYDITGATITITNPSGTVLINSTSMGTAVYDSGYATKIYEYAYTVPLGSATGTWTAKVVAAEGSEGTTTYSLTEPMTVGVPNVFILKSANTSSANPGAIITYTVHVKNTGVGTANTVTLTDAIGKYIAVPVTSSFSFTDGSPASGLTLGTPSYSSDNGSTWTYTPVSGGGGAPANYDGLVTNWKIIMNGTMNGNGGNFTINYNFKVK